MGGVCVAFLQMANLPGSAKSIFFTTIQHIKYQRGLHKKLLLAISSTMCVCIENGEQASRKASDLGAESMTEWIVWHHREGYQHGNSPASSVPEGSFVKTRGNKRYVVRQAKQEAHISETKDALGLLSHSADSLHW